MSDHARFQVKGSVIRVFAAQSGTFARVTVGVYGEREKKIDVVAFRDKVALVSELASGQEVTISGDIAMEKLTDKARNEVKVDGFAKWHPMLVADKVEVAASSKKPDDRNPNGW